MKNNKSILILFAIIIIAVLGFVFFSPSSLEYQRIEETVDSAKTVEIYTNKELGISFAYPQIFGEISIEIDPRPIEAGHWFLGRFSQNDKLIFGGITDDFRAGRSGMLTDTRGFMEEAGNYYFKFVAEKLDHTYPLQPFKVFEKDFGKILLLNDQSFEAERNGLEGPILGVGQNNYAVLLNLAGDDYSGIAILNQDTTLFPLEDFETMIHSIAVFPLED